MGKHHTPLPDMQESAAAAVDQEPMPGMAESGLAAALPFRPPVQAMTSSPQTELVNPNSQTDFIDLLRRVCPPLAETASALKQTWAGITGSVASPAVVADTYQRLQVLRNLLANELDTQVLQTATNK
jgi:hypothetical protein